MLNEYQHNFAINSAETTPIHPATRGTPQLRGVSPDESVSVFIVFHFKKHLKANRKFQKV